MSLKTLLQAFGILAVLLSLFPFVAADYWWIRMFDFPHVQLTILTLCALLFYFFRFDLRNWRDYAFVGILGACFLLQLVKILPYTPFAEKQVADNEEYNPQRTFSLLAANVLQKNTEYRKVLDEVLEKDPDLLVFTETDKKWQQELRKGLKGFGYNYRLEEPLPNTYGMLFYSKFPLEDARVRYLMKDSIPSMHGKIKLPSGEKVAFHLLHPTPPMLPHDSTSTDRDAQMMIVAKMAKNSPLPVIVAGDFNDVAWSETTSLFQKVSGLLDPRQGRGFYNTFSANSWIMRWPLDHLFVSEEFRLVDLSLGQDVNSDHFPFYAKLSLEPETPEEKEPKPASTEELKEAETQIEKGQQQKAKADAAEKN